MRARVPLRALVSLVVFTCHFHILLHVIFHSLDLLHLLIGSGQFPFLKLVLRTILCGTILLYIN